MRSKLWFLTKYSLVKKMSSKWFKVVNILLALVLIAIVNLDTIITFFGGDFNNELEVVVIDNTQEVASIFNSSLEQVKTSLDENAKIKVTSSSSTLEKEKEKLDDEVLISFDSDINEILKVKIISKEPIDTIDYQILTSALTSTKYNYGLIKSNIDQNELSKVSAPVSIERIILDENSKSLDDSMSTVMGTVFPTVILPFFMLIIILVQMIGAEINEEKSTRSMEVIISNVSAKTHFFSKIIANNVFVVGQAILLGIYVGIGFIIRFLLGTNVDTTSIFSSFEPIISSLVKSGFVDKLTYIIPLTLLLMILSFLAYSLIAGILASMTTNMEDYQQIQTPIVIILLVAYYLAIMASMFNGSIFIRIISYIPFISCLVSPALLVLGQITIIDVIISIIFLVIFNVVAIKYGLKLYKVGILNYSNEKIWKRVKKIVNTKEI